MENIIEKIKTNKEKAILALVITIFVVVSAAAYFDLKIKSTTNTNNIKTGTTAITGINNNKPPEAAITACTNKAIGDTCEFVDKEKTTNGKCDNKPGMLACAPDKGSENQNKTTPSEQTKNTDTTTSTTLSSGTNSCINNTKDNPQCKDCCDCLSGVDSATRTSCRNTCATHDFTKNSNFITVSSSSVLGRNGDYSVALTQTTVNACKTYCENSMGLKCGDYQYCRMACDNKWGVTPGPGGLK